MPIWLNHKNEKKFKKIILFDFDGVIHSYKSGWYGPRVIKDEPVTGAIEFIIALLLNTNYEVCIYSSRSKHFGGRRAMKKWIYDIFITKSALSYEQTPEPYRSWIAETAFADPWEDEIDIAAKRLLRKIKWPIKKPGAYLTIDDRCICFDGNFSTLLDKIEDFKSWKEISIAHSKTR